MNDSTTASDLSTVKFVERTRRDADAAKATLTKLRCDFAEFAQRAVDEPGVVSAVNLSDGVERLAVAEGAARFYSVAMNLLDEGHLVADVVEFGVGEALRSDDTWSGRTNDVRRSTADGFRQAFERFYRRVQYEQL